MYPTLLSFLLILLFTITSFLETSEARWQSTNPGGGGALNSPVITKEGYWVVGSDLGGLYVSKTEGRTWYAVGSRQGLTATHVSSLVSHPRGRLLIGTDVGIFLGRSDATRIQPVRLGGYISAIEVSPANSNVVYAISYPSSDSLDFSVLRSTDGGRTFNRIRGSRTPQARIVGLRAHPRNSNVVWFIAGEGRFAESPPAAYRSMNGGRTWERRDLGTADLVVDLSYAHDIRNEDRMFMTTLSDSTGRFWKSENGGVTWLEVTPRRPIGGDGISGVILIDAAQPDHVRVVDLMMGPGREYVWETFNAGLRWQRTIARVRGGWSYSDEDWGLGYSFNGVLQTIGYRMDDAQTILWANVQFVYKSLDGGKTWRDAVSMRKGRDRYQSRKLDNVVPIVIEPSAADPQLIYVGYLDLGIWRSTDGGKSWEAINDVEWTYLWRRNGGNTLTIAADPERANVVWAQMAGDLDGNAHIVKSTDRGTTWREVSSGLPRLPRMHIESLAIAFDSATTNRWLYVIVDGAVYRSETDGNSWNIVFRCESCVGVRYTYHSGVIAFGPTGIFRSWYGGNTGTWDDISGNLPASARSGWTRRQHWLEDKYTYVGPVDIAWGGESDLWLVVKGNGVFHSGDHGDSWSLVFANRFVRSVAVEKRGSVLVGSSSALSSGFYSAGSRGVVMHANGKSRRGWRAMNRGLVFPFATFVTVGEDGQRWCVSPGQGVMKWE